MVFQILLILLPDLSLSPHFDFHEVLGFSPVLPRIAFESVFRYILVEDHYHHVPEECEDEGGEVPECVLEFSYSLFSKAQQRVQILEKKQQGYYSGKEPV